jgi:hypothetical protein
MQMRLGTIFFLAVSLGLLTYGILTHETWAMFSSIAAAWLGLVASSMLVHEQVPPKGARRFWSRVQLTVAVALPVFSWLWLQCSAVLAAFVGGSQTAVLCWAILIPMALFIVATAMALNRFRGVSIVTVAGGIVAWFCTRAIMQESYLAIAVWLAIASVSIGQLVSAHWIAAKPIKPGVCGKCGYDLHGLTRSTPCPECGTPWSPFV